MQEEGKKKNTEYYHHEEGILCTYTKHLCI